jgi:ArsR family transcriptional regulator
MAKSLYTNTNYEKTAELFKAVANTKRLKLLSIIADREATVNEISEGLKTRKSNTSQHLNLLKLMGFVKSRKQDKNIFYKVSNPRIVKLLKLFS